MRRVNMDGDRFEETEREMTFQIFWPPGATCRPSVVDLITGPISELPRRYAELIQELTKPGRLGYEPLPSRIVTLR